MNESRIVKQLDKMVALGRMTESEANRLRAAQGTPEFELVLGEVRARHASAYLDAAVEDRRMTEEEAEDQRQKLRRGEHPKGLRARLRMHRTAKDEG